MWRRSRRPSRGTQDDVCRESALPNRSKRCATPPTDARATGSRPKVFLANLGTLADFTARATFAKNFFEAGGIEAVANEDSPAATRWWRRFKASGAQARLPLLVG